MKGDYIWLPLGINRLNFREKLPLSILFSVITQSSSPRVKYEQEHEVVFEIFGKKSLRLHVFSYQVVQPSPKGLGPQRSLHGRVVYVQSVGLSEAYLLEVFRSVSYLLREAVDPPFLASENDPAYWPLRGTGLMSKITRYKELASSSPSPLPL